MNIINDWLYHADAYLTWGYEWTDTQWGLFL
jgi:hypothetical protein